MAVKALTQLSKFLLLNKPAIGFVNMHNHFVSALKPELELHFNSQINTEYFASFTYLAMASYFARQNVALPGFQKYFSNQAHEEQEHAQKFINYLNKRGNYVFLQTIPQPKNSTWEFPLTAFKEALSLELTVSQKIFQLYEHCDKLNDVCACNFLENEFLDEQVEEVDKLMRIITQLEKIGPDGLGIYLFDRHLLKNK